MHIKATPHHPPHLTKFCLLVEKEGTRPKTPATLVYLAIWGVIVDDRKKVGKSGAIPLYDDGISTRYCAIRERHLANWAAKLVCFC